MDESNGLYDAIGLAARFRQMREAEHPIKSRQVTSELCGLHSDAYRRYERGEAIPDLISFVKIAEHFGVSMEWLWYGT